MIVKLNAFDVTPPGFVTVINTVPAAPSVTFAKSELALRKTGVTDVEPKLTTAPSTKSDPVIVRAVAAPAVPDEGVTETMTGATFVNGNVARFDGPPPGAGLMTWIVVDVARTDGSNSDRVEGSIYAADATAPST